MADLPDVTKCRHCLRTIVWDDWSYVHLDGWANCRDPNDLTKLAENTHCEPIEQPKDQ